MIALILPGLSIYSNEVLMRGPYWQFWLVWLLSSSFLYLIWQISWRIWGPDLRIRNFWIIPLLLISVIVFSYSIQVFSLGEPQAPVWILSTRVVLGISIILTIQYALKAQENISRLQVEKEQILTENYRSQLQVLRSKIDPHFLFNSLNTLRAMVRQHNPNSEEFVMSLSQFYRQTLHHHENPTLPLRDEMKMLKSYLFLMQRRNENAIQVEDEIEKEVLVFHLPTLALQVVVENCLKHNRMTSKEPLRIQLKNTASGYIQISNNKQAKLKGKEPSGFGLDLLQKRYQLMNISKGIVVEETEEQFIVRLKLIIT